MEIPFSVGAEIDMDEGLLSRLVIGWSVTDSIASFLRQFTDLSFNLQSIIMSINFTKGNMRIFIV
ncbi:hypothetical protein GCM10011571_30530 [Marinithermofilum abyssi]|uniref:Uncharacterized protein n=1 Tax=Marinithermofilum abyssi TaxID=1571185 RepID=A0A8J2VIM2_9BACL|nr:hypothetical protein GCM10011571_30530 [Marinithermofilum abyssi]